VHEAGIRCLDRRKVLGCAAVHHSVERTRVTDWLTRSQQRTWVTYMRVYHRLEYEMNRQLQAEFDLSLGDYTVLNALSNAKGKRMQLTSLATLIGWERSRLSHHLVRMTKRGLVDRLQSNIDGRATDAALTTAGWKAVKAAAPHHVAWVQQLFFSDLDKAKERELGDILTSVYETILREGTLPRPIEFSG
jgi:DNA-binding MarR family transcriptional regulator